jgi:hypothetical protein
MVISIQKMADSAESDACDSSCTSRTEGWDTGVAVLAKVSTAVEADACVAVGVDARAAVGMTFLPATTYAFHAETACPFV